MRLVVNDLEVEVRPGRPEDVPVLLGLMRAMAEFEKLTLTATEESLQVVLFGDRPAAQVLLVFVEGDPVGYVTYFFSFASMTGRRGLWLDDVFLEPDYRGRGIGRALMTHLAEIARDNECARFEWMVLDWNTRAIAFYERLGAKVETDLRICRLDEAGLRRLAERSGSG